MRWGWKRRGPSPAATSADRSLDGPILRPDDGWYRAVGAELEAREAEERRPLSALLSTDLGARPNQHAQWRQQLRDLEPGRHRWALRMLPRMLGALADAVPLVEPGQGADGRPLLVALPNTACAVNVIWAAVELGRDQSTPTIGRILLRAVSEPWIMQSVRIRNACANALAEIGSPDAADLLSEAAGLAPAKAVREQLFLCVDLATGKSEQLPSRRAELRVSNHGLDTMGRRELIVRRHAFELRIQPNGQVTVTQQTGEATPDEAAKRVIAAEARAVRSTYRKEVARIEALLATERDWAPGDWRRIYGDHPITRAVAGRLIWRHTYADGRAIDRVPGWGADGALSYPAEGTRWSEPPNADLAYRISLWHPSEAEPALLASWRVAGRRHGLVQPFEQIERNFTRHAPDSDATELAQQAGSVVDADRFAAVARRLGWQATWKRPGAHNDSIRTTFRTFPDARLSLVVPFAAGRPTGDVVLSTGWFHRTEDHSRTPLPLGAIPPRVYSEAVRDLSVLANARSEPEDEIPFSDALESREPEDEIPDRIG